MSETSEQNRSEILEQLAKEIYADGEPQSIYDSIVRHAVRLVDGCDHASIMLKASGRYMTIAATSDVALLIDTLERQVGEGPCVDAIEDEGVQSDPDINKHATWPGLAKLVREQTDVRGMMGIRLLVDNRKIGALNLFANEADAFSEDSIDQAAIIASFASMAMMTLSARDQATTMERGLDSNRQIGKAIGLLMAAHKFSEDEAFDLLKRTSQNLNMKLAHVARKVVEGQQDQFQS
ncbi:ANTAR domain-containing protein [Epidermidibacterium keratini]|uniref:ANTAR domain-containing protein n=1 Tax=Epidermidibacterium keratini TaxID=1891644 RepID=A0A7L4YQ35_9ACTN|nr:GAF and ANTAR domain-containing protein [Epidermidibacterium keratini]QHC00667.1 ANTAR domain-containing protein [Epidermidibacterium keratini]